MQNANNFQEYIEHLCRRHVDVRHEKEGIIHFVNMNEQLLNDLESKVGFPVVMLERDSFRYDGVSGANFKNNEYGLFILDHVSDGNDFDAIESAFRQCERILDELFNQILQDKHSHGFLRGFNLSADGERIRNVSNTLEGVVAYFVLPEAHCIKNCRKAFLQDRSFNESFDKTFK